MKLLSKKPNIRFAEDVPTSGAQQHRVTGGGALDRRHRPPSAILLKRAPMGLGDYEPEQTVWDICTTPNPDRARLGFVVTDTRESAAVFQAFAHPTYGRVYDKPREVSLSTALDTARAAGFQYVCLASIQGEKIVTLKEWPV